MQRPRLARFWSFGALAVPLSLVAVMLRGPQAPEPAAMGAAPPAALPQRPSASPAPAAFGIAQAAESARQSVQQQPTAPPTAEPTPTPRPPSAPKRIGLQVGHWKSEELPDELARLRTSSGTFAAGRSETSVNLDIARRVAQLLEQRGFVVDIIPATVPVGYDADAFVAIHADGSRSASSRGFKIATPWRTSRAAQHLADTIGAEYATTTGLPRDGAITFNMRGYYAFNYRRHQYAVARTTPAVIVEMGFLTNAADRALMLGRPDRVATGIANGITRYLGEHDFNDGASLFPPEYKSQRALSPDGVDVRAAPRDDAPVLAHAGADRRFNPLQERDGWFQVFVRDGERRLIGWVRKDLLAPTDDPTPTPPPATDS